MSGMDEYLKAVELNMKGFASGMQSLQRGLATRDAQQELNQINANVSDEKKRAKLANQVGQNLALRLTGAGVEPAAVQAASEGLVPSASSVSTTKGQKDMQQESLASAERIQQMKNDALLGKRQNKFGGFITDYQKRFNKESDKIQTSLQNVEQIFDVLKTGNPIGDASVKTFFARASGEVGNLSVQEQAQYGGSRAIIDRIKNINEQLNTGKMSDANRKFATELAQTYKTANERKMEEVADKYANQAFSAASKSGFETTPEELRQMIHPGQQSKQEKRMVKKQYSPSQNKTKLIYNDGSEEIVDGQR